MFTCISKNLIYVFIIRLTSTVAFAVFYSGLSLILTKQKLISLEMATIITGLFLSLNFFLPTLGGTLAKFFNSYKQLYCIANIFSVVGCILLAANKNIYLGLSLILINSLLAHVCIKMFVINLFTDEQTQQRKTAFLWNYVAMNIGALLGFCLCGYFFIQNDLAILFEIMAGFFTLSLIFTLCLQEEHKTALSLTRYALIMMALLCLTAVCTFLLSHAYEIHIYFSILPIILLSLLSVYLIAKSECKYKAVKFVAYSCLNILFWMIYMLVPVAFLQLIENGVDRKFGSYEIASQWFVNIDSLTILIFSSVSAYLLKKYNPSTMLYYACGLFFTSLSLFILAHGIHESSNMKISAISMLSCLVLLALAELFIGPTTDSLIGELVSKSLRSIMVGYVSLIIGVGVILSTYLSRILIIPYIEHGSIGQHIDILQNNVKSVAMGVLFIPLAIITINYLSRYNYRRIANIFFAK